jgi:hypothetical protein
LQLAALFGIEIKAIFISKILYGWAARLTDWAVRMAQK